MQVIAESANRGRRRPVSGLAGLAQTFEEHWNELLRFVLNRRMYRSPAGDLSHMQLGALRLLEEHDVRMSDLASRLGLAESTTTRLVDRLEAAGLVRRGTSLPDRRCVMAGLTRAGRQVTERVRKERREFLTEILQTLPEKERAELVKLFGQVAAELRAREESRT
jgi:DNA-binding MarR family transcriptional regulator